MNLPNKLTISRILLIPFFVGFLCIHYLTASPVIISIGRWLALVVFVVAAITDYYDGVIARRNNIVTRFGQLFDPLADKLLTMAAFVAFVELRGPDNEPIFPAWAIIVILAREFLVTGLRSVAISNGRLIAADKWGKHKTVWQISGIIAILVILSLHATLTAMDYRIGWVETWVPVMFRVVLVPIIVLTAGSGIVFLIKNWDVVSERN